MTPDFPHRGLAPQAYHGRLHRALMTRASHRYRTGGRFSHGFARGKLWTDPLFIDLLRHGLLPSSGRLLDLGCGQAVLAAWLLAAEQQQAAGGWPDGWPAAPRLSALTCMELMPADVARAQQALADAPQVDVRQANIITTPFPQVEVVTILDVLHYFDRQAQHQVLSKIRDCLTPGGRLVARVGNAGSGWRFELSRRVDQVVTTVRGHRWSDLYTQSAADWARDFQALGFETEVLASKGGPPFANTFVIGRLPERAQSASTTGGRPPEPAAVVSENHVP